MKKFSVKAFALAGGILWGVSLGILTLLAYFTDVNFSQGLLESIVKPLYGFMGYEISLTGALLGLIYGFIDGAVGCAIFAWLYNFFAKK